MAMFPREVLVGHVGAHRTQSLFLETNKSSLEPIMVLKEIDWEYKGKLLPSLKKIYLSFNDPTEYQVAMEVFGSWNQWKRLCDNALIFAHIKEWREELEIKLRSQAVKALIATAQEDGAKGTTAAKYVAEKGWDKRKAGAPSKEEVAREKKIHAGINDDVEDDLTRLGLH